MGMNRSGDNEVANSSDRYSGVTSLRGFHRRLARSSDGPSPGGAFRARLDLPDS